MSITSPYRVHVVVDPDFGQRLAEMPAGEPVWIVTSPINEPVVRQLWEQRPSKSHLDGITMSQSHGSPKDSFLDVLDSMNLHHGEHSTTPPYSLLEVVGCAPSEEVRSAMVELGFIVTATSSEGFSAQRPIPVA